LSADLQLVLSLSLSWLIEDSSVKFDNEWSGLSSTQHGVPQGSILDSLLFIMYISGIIKICPDKCEIFADDALIYVTAVKKREMNVFKVCLIYSV